MRTLSPPTVESARERISTCSAAAQHTLSLARAPSAQESPRYPLKEVDGEEGNTPEAIQVKLT
jgi:hypothetical protein